MTQIVASKKWCLEQYIVARELHEDGTPHLHCYLRLDRKVNIGSQSLFDIQGHHPNLQGVKSNAAVVAYVMKDDNFVSNLTKEEIQELMLSRKQKTAFIGKNLMEQGLTYQTLKENPTLMLKDLSKL